jgi:hypothetical protein
MHADREVTEGKYRCPGCGGYFDHDGECEGTAEAGHAPIRVESTAKVEKAKTPVDDDGGDGEAKTKTKAAAK